MRISESPSKTRNFSREMPERWNARNMVSRRRERASSSPSGKSLLFILRIDNNPYHGKNRTTISFGSRCTFRPHEEKVEPKNASLHLHGEKGNPHYRPQPHHRVYGEHGTGSKAISKVRQEYFICSDKETSARHRSRSCAIC